MDYKAAFRKAVEEVRGEGRYRVFADLKRHRGAFPFATWTPPAGAPRDVIVWCSNDYLGQGQNPVVTEAMKATIDLCGAGSGGSTARSRRRNSGSIPGCPSSSSWAGAKARRR